MKKLLALLALTAVCNLAMADDKSPYDEKANAKE